MTSLPARAAYARWAPTYDDENVVTTLDCEAIERLSPGTAGKRLLDVGCGTGRRLVGTGASHAVGVEPCAEMLTAGRAKYAFGTEVRFLEGDARSLPVPGEAFDLVWCRLMIGHVADCHAVYRELARACAPGGMVVVTDFHPEAAESGMTRSFKSGDAEFDVEHHIHTFDGQVRVAERAGLRLADRWDGRVGPAVRHFYASAGRLVQYERQLGIALVLGLAYQRDG